MIKAMRNTITTEQLLDVDLFSPLTELQIEEIVRKSSISSFKKNRIIYEDGEEIKNVYFVLEGSVKLGTNASNGKTLIKNIAYANEIFGENIFTSFVQRKEFAEAMRDATVLIIPINTFKQIAASNHQFAQAITRVIIERLQNLEERMQSFVFKKAKKRIIDFIRKTASLKGIKIGLDEILIHHGMSHKEIAFLTDTSRQTVARVLGELKRENIIHFSARKPSKILIRDIVALG